jgi:hypothetical protein
MGDDASTIHDECGAHNFGTLRRISLMLLQRGAPLKRGIAAKRPRRHATRTT